MNPGPPRCKPKFAAHVTCRARCARGAAMSLYARYSALLGEVLDALEAEGSLPVGLNRGPVAVEPPRDASHGDLATNAAMVLAKGAGTNPRALAGLIAPKLEALPDVTEVTIAGPGFINLRLTDAVWRAELATII